MRNLFLASLFTAVFLSACNERSEFQEIVVERSDLALPDDGEVDVETGWTKLENGKYRARFTVPPSFLSIYRGSNAPAAADPFADPVEEQPSLSIQRITAQSVLEEVGVIFEEGTSAKMISTGLMEVEQTQDQMELIEVFLDSFRGPNRPKQIAIRMEIFELSDFAALKILEGSAGHGEHGAERNAIVAAVKEGKAQLIASPQIIAKSGQRAKVESIEERFSFLKRDDQSETEDEKSTVKEDPERSEYSVGTILEVDPVLGADNFTIDLNVSLTHDTDDAETDRSADAVSKHQKSITTQITLLHGDYVILGNWKPTGKFEHEGKTHIVFLTAAVQATGPGKYNE